MNSMPPVHPRFEYCSDLDGVRFAAINAGAIDLNGWRLEVQDEDGEARQNRFQNATLWGAPDNWNFLGYGEPGTAWVAVADHGYRAVALISPDGRRTVLGTNE